MSCGLRSSETRPGNEGVSKGQKALSERLPCMTLHLLGDQKSKRPSLEPGLRAFPPQHSTNHCSPKLQHLPGSTTSKPMKPSPGQGVLVRTRGLASNASTESVAAHNIPLTLTTLKTGLATYQSNDYVAP
jgi:hypothetical protein